MKNSKYDKALVRSLEAKLEQARLVGQNLDMRRAEIEAEILEILAAIRKAKGDNDDDQTFRWDDQF